MANDEAAANLDKVTTYGDKPEEFAMDEKVGWEWYHVFFEYFIFLFRRPKGQLRKRKLQWKSFNSKS